MTPRRRVRQQKQEAEPQPIWHEWMVGVELAFLRLSPLYWGYGIPHGDGSAVVLVPGFLGTDLYLTQFGSWLRRIGYEPFYSGIHLNADCPNLLIERYLHETIQRARKSSSGKIHLIGHSLGGALALAAASQMPDCVESVITLGSPIRGISGHASVLRAADFVRQQILENHGPEVLPKCFTSQCTCNFIESLKGKTPKGVRHTAIYTKNDGVVDWQVCTTGDPEIDVEVSATHIGMVFSPLVYSAVAHRLAGE
ncbi:MAG TPA: alpha/beta fold hydrolase [Candidatus Acidoferrum sp.]|nr:alpha/beta fold hydrolase [Candidatus Acidoferrum sp.]